MNKHQNQSSSQPKRAIPVPKIVKPGPTAATGTHAHPPDPKLPLKPTNVLKAVHKEKHSPWLTTAKIPRHTIPRIP